MEDRLVTYKAGQQDVLEKMVPHLLRLDYYSLAQLEEFYQTEQHSKFFGTPLASEEVAEIHALSKGAHHFLMWLKEKNRKTQSEG